MASKTEGQHPGEFIVWERDLEGSRKLGTVTSGQNLKDGQLVQLVSGKLVAKAITLNTAGHYTVPIEGIIIGNHDASASGANADIPKVPYIYKDALVKDALLTYPAGTPQKTEAVLELDYGTPNAIGAVAARNINVR